MPRLFFLLLSLFISLVSFAQYKNDNVLFKTVFPQDLCKELSRNKGYVLLDVRSPGEHHDTSTMGGNIGKLDGAINIDIIQLAQQWKQLETYKDKPVFVYCSHSQRSRRASKMLADSGFTQVFNINGGMTALHLLDDKQKDCLNSLVKTSNSYSLISSLQLCKRLSSDASSVFLLDVRPDSAWNRTALNSKMNAYGYFKGAKHIALAELKNKLSEVPKDKVIVVTDLFGGDAGNAAKLLKETGYTNVYALMEGMDRWLYSDKKDWGCGKDLYVSPVKYNIMSSGEFSRFLPANKNVLLLDVRSAEEFAGTHKDAFRNIGHLKNAINIPAAEINDRIADLEKYKSSPVVIYSFGSGAEMYAVANALAGKGFTNVNVLVGGLFNVRWTASNVAGMYFMHDWVEGVPEENK